MQHHEAVGEILERQAPRFECFDQFQQSETRLIQT
jgi:hypothetical protein